VRCNAQTLECQPNVETFDISEIPATDAAVPSCDNRPLYHQQNPPEDTPGSLATYHYLPFFPWRDLVVDSQPGENIYGMTWDSLYGTDQGLTPFFKQSNEFFKQNARGVILDHRAGSGGTRDAPAAITELVRAPADLSVGPTFMMTAGDDGPATDAEGIARFEQLAKIPTQVYEVGSAGADVSIPVALLLHRDGSASDWLPHGMKGAPNVRIFAPHETAGAFSSFYEFSYWSRFAFQMASGDTITSEGKTLIGHGVEPDVVVQHTQTSLLQGTDLPYEMALSWVRANLK
jgi:C-terminal processing protease CtpA/Prc